MTFVRQGDTVFGVALDIGNYCTLSLFILYITNNILIVYQYKNNLNNFYWLSSKLEKYYLQSDFYNVVYLVTCSLSDK